jgi:hypothetical protein
VHSGVDSGGTVGEGGTFACRVGRGRAKETARASPARVHDAVCVAGEPLESSAIGGLATFRCTDPAQ